MMSLVLYFAEVAFADDDLVRIAGAVERCVVASGSQPSGRVLVVSGILPVKQQMPQAKKSADRATFPKMSRWEDAEKQPIRAATWVAVRTSLGLGVGSTRARLEQLVRETDNQWSDDQLATSERLMESARRELREAVNKAVHSINEGNRQFWTRRLTESRAMEDWNLTTAAAFEELEENRGNIQELKSVYVSLPRPKRKLDFERRRIYAPFWYSRPARLADDDYNRKAVLTHCIELRDLLNSRASPLAGSFLRKRGWQKLNEYLRLKHDTLLSPTDLVFDSLQAALDDDQHALRLAEQRSREYLTLIPNIERVRLAVKTLDDLKSQTDALKAAAAKLKARDYTQHADILARILGHAPLATKRTNCPLPVKNVSSTFGAMPLLHLSLSGQDRWFAVVDCARFVRMSTKDDTFFALPTNHQIFRLTLLLDTQPHILARRSVGHVSLPPKRIRRRLLPADAAWLVSRF